MKIVPTKKELIELYEVKKMSLGQIAEQFGYKTHHPIRNLFIKYEISRRTKEEATNLLHKSIDDAVKIDKNTLSEDLKNFSILQLVKKYNVTKSRIYNWMKEYGLENTYYKNLDLKEILKSESNDVSAKHLAIKYNVTTTLIKKFKSEFRTHLYTIDEIKEKIIEYKYDISNRGFPKQLFYDDKALYDSIIFHSEGHVLDTDKITERLYRIVNDYNKNQIVECTHCGTKLQFYNYIKGYGFSDYKLCGECNNILNGVSKMSQGLFWKLYNNLSDKSSCYFHDLNKEYILYMDEDFKNNNERANKRFYKLDFLYYNKIIEFDGTYYHKDIEKDQTANKYFIHKGYKILRITENEFTKYPDQTIEKCLIFLNQ